MSTRPTAKTKGKKSQSFQDLHLQEQGGASQSVTTIIFPALREVLHAVEDTQKTRDIAILEAGVSKRYVSQEKSTEDHCQRHDVEFQAGELNCEKVFNVQLLEE